MKKIWVCGANGMLGSHFTRLLNERKIPFVATGSQEVDITQVDPVNDFMRSQKFTHVINCAAYTQVDQAEKEQKQAYLLNALGPYHLGNSGKRYGTQVIHFSTDYVFDGKGHKPYTEESPCGPLGAYGLSKLAGEMKLLDELKNACIIRTSWLYGLPGKNFVATMLKLMKEREQLRVVVDQVGRPTYCQDLAEATLEMLDQKGIFHFANSDETSWHQFAVEIAKQAKELGFPLIVKQIDPIPSSEYPTPAQRPSYSTLSTKKIEAVLGHPPRSWKKALNDYLQKYKVYQETGAISA